MSEVTQEMIDAFTEAWEAKREEIGRGIAPAGTKTRAGLEAVLRLRDQVEWHCTRCDYPCNRHRP
jgi:hypothetical protein